MGYSTTTNKKLPISYVTVKFRESCHTDLTSTHDVFTIYKHNVLSGGFHLYDPFSNVGKKP